MKPEVLERWELVCSTTLNEIEVRKLSGWGGGVIHRHYRLRCITFSHLNAVALHEWGRQLLLEAESKDFPRERSPPNI